MDAGVNQEKFRDRRPAGKSRLTAFGTAAGASNTGRAADFAWLRRFGDLRSPKFGIIVRLGTVAAQATHKPLSQHPFDGRG